jgi:hypothetical protein
MSVKTEETPPILAHKHYSAASAFKPENLLREARRQKNLPEAPVPEICILDPDGDIVRYLCNAGLADCHPGWACYHTDLYVFREGGHEYGILGCIVGAAFAVLVAEELFASGCRFLVSMTSSGQILPVQAPPYFVVIERALRDDGTSYHYLQPSDYSEAALHLTQMAREALTAAGISDPVRGDMDHRCSIPRNGEGDRRGKERRHSCSRDGGGSALRFCEGSRLLGALLCTRNQPDGSDRGRL